VHFEIDPRIFAEFPGARVGVVAARGLDNRGDGAEIRRLLAAEERRVAEELAGVAVVEHPHIAPWRDAYRRFGAKPKKYRSSIENLVRRALKGNPLPSINPLVDLYNAVSLRHLLPVGGESLERITGSIELTFAGESEAPVRLLGERQERPPHPGEVIYRDAAGAICRRWNWKEAERTKLTPETRDAVLVIEALPPAGEAQLDAALADLAGLIERFCGGRLARHQLYDGRPGLDLEEEIR
jgi:DNA/RNA-binding domain of Phe-tRNA-synthetase-like protein